MRLLQSFAIIALITSAALPCVAQSLPIAPATGLRSSPGHEQHEAMRAAFRACMAPHVEAIKPQVAVHMQAFRAANPSATMEVRRAERKSFSMPLIGTFLAQCKASAAAGTGARAH